MSGDLSRVNWEWIENVVFLIDILFDVYVCKTEKTWKNLRRWQELISLSSNGESAPAGLHLRILSNYT